MIQDVRILAGDMFNIHPSMGYQDIKESKVIVIAVNTKAVLRHYPGLIHKQVVDNEEELLADAGLTPEELSAYKWVVYADNEDIYALPLEDFINHTTVL